MPGPWCPRWGEGGGRRNLAEAICPGKGTLQEAVERPGARGELEWRVRMSKKPGAGRASGQNICFDHPA